MHAHTPSIILRINQRPVSLTAPAATPAPSCRRAARPPPPWTPVAAAALLLHRLHYRQLRPCPPAALPGASSAAGAGPLALSQLRRGLCVSGWGTGSDMVVWGQSHEGWAPLSNQDATLCVQRRQRTQSKRQEKQTASRLLSTHSAHKCHHGALRTQVCVVVLASGGTPVFRCCFNRIKNVCRVPCPRA